LFVHDKGIPKYHASIFITLQLLRNLHCFVQNSAEDLSIISLLYDAKKKIDKWPSRAPDKGTVERNTIHLLTTMLNKLNTSCEYSGPQNVAHF
jgi:hypothetical protein